jgi:monoamine oxidase
MIDVAVVGAGAAGLACAQALRDGGRSVEVLEARTRIGGRIHTRRILEGVPIEGGAEFVHGKSPPLWKVLKAAKLRVAQIRPEHVAVYRGQRERGSQLWGEMMQALGEAGSRERTVKAWLDEPQFRRRERLRAFIRMYIEGFHAADPARASLRAIFEQGESSEEIEGEALFRVLDGYDGVARRLARELSPRLNTVVSSVTWRRHRVTLTCASQAGVRLPDVVARQVVITVPVPLLKKLPFSPALPTEKRRAIAGIALGPVVKVHLRFREPIWTDLPLDMLHVLGAPVPTFWTPAPFDMPMLVGWAAGPVAERLPDDERGILACAAATLTRALKIDRRRYEAALEWWCVTDWRADRFAGGAYSWVPVGHDGMQERLGAPVDDTLFFAGEATHPTQNGTVHGAIETGLRAARELLKVS